MIKLTDKTLIIKRYPMNEMPPNPEPEGWAHTRAERIADGLVSIHLYDPQTNTLHCYLLEPEKEVDAIHISG